MFLRGVSEFSRLVIQKSQTCRQDESRSASRRIPEGRPYKGAGATGTQLAMNKRWVALAAPATLTSAPLFALSELRDQWGKIRDAHAAWRSWQRPPWVGVFAPPKSASTFVWAVLARLLNADRTVFNTVHPRDGGLQLTHELDSKRMQDRRGRTGSKSRARASAGRRRRFSAPSRSRSSSAS